MQRTSAIQKSAAKKWLSWVIPTAILFIDLFLALFLQPPHDFYKLFFEGFILIVALTLTGAFLLAAETIWGPIKALLYMVTVLMTLLVIFRAVFSH